MNIFLRNSASACFYGRYRAVPRWSSAATPTLTLQASDGGSGSGSARNIYWTRSASTQATKERAQESVHSPARAQVPAQHEGKASMEDIVSLCKRKGFVFPSSEIYSAAPGFFDYGPLGVELKNNLKAAWWREFVHGREDVVGLDSSVISSAAVWEASGHVAGFSDPMVDCRKSKLRYRADQVFWGKLEQQQQDDQTAVDAAAAAAATNAVYVSLVECADMQAQAERLARSKAQKLGLAGPFKAFAGLRDLTCPSLSEEEYARIPSPATGEPGQLTAPRAFNLMFQTSIGATNDASSVGYLRPETAQGIFTNFLNVQRTSRLKVPFGIAQIGKAFRNEITPRNFIFRSREFEQMELEYFVNDQPDEEWHKQYQYWVTASMQWLQKIGLPEASLQLDVKTAESGLAHYARACTDIKFEFPFGSQELMGVAARGNFDLQTHSKHSGQKLDYLDPSSGRRYVPHVIEPSLGVDRLFLAVLTAAYHEETVPVISSEEKTSADTATGKGTATATSTKSAAKVEKRIVLRLHPSIAPVKVSVLPLVSNKTELSDKAKGLYKKLLRRYNCEYDSSGAIGRRYRRADESGTPYCVTIDYESLQDGKVTVRLRDSMSQLRMSESELVTFLAKEIEGL